jgi:FkbM family methyltransferase
MGIAGKLLTTVVPVQNRLLYRLCRAVVNRHDADNNSDMATNGETYLMWRFLPSAKVVFDIGANRGQWTHRALEINPNAEYHCFEPGTAAYQVLAARNFPANVLPRPFGLGDAPREMMLHIYDSGDEANSLYSREGLDLHASQQATVWIDTLDDYCEQNGVEYIDFAKIDVEGHEFSVLRGAERMLTTGRIGVVQFEYGCTYIDARVFLKDIWDFIMGANPDYAFFKLYPSDLRRVPVYSQTLDTFQYSNWVVVNREIARQTLAGSPC